MGQTALKDRGPSEASVTGDGFCTRRRSARGRCDVAVQLPVISPLGRVAMHQESGFAKSLSAVSGENMYIRQIQACIRIIAAGNSLRWEDYPENWLFFAGDLFSD